MESIINSGQNIEKFITEGYSLAEGALTEGLDFDLSGLLDIAKIFMHDQCDVKRYYNDDKVTEITK